MKQIFVGDARLVALFLYSEFVVVKDDRAKALAALSLRALVLQVFQVRKALNIVVVFHSVNIAQLFCGALRRLDSAEERRDIVIAQAIIPRLTHQPLEVALIQESVVALVATDGEPIDPHLLDHVLQISDFHALALLLCRQLLLLQMLLEVD